MYAQGARIASNSIAYRESQSAEVLYNDALLRGRRGQTWAGLTGRSRALPIVDEVFKGCTIQARSSGGTRPVAIAQICGSENRIGDFDCDFNPLQDHTRDRWLSIASALQRGRCLPPIALIQVGDRYFVRDGHHRISAARALGQHAIKASVEVWHVDQPVTDATSRRRAGSNRTIGDWLRSTASGAVSGLLRPAGGATSRAAA